MNVMQPRYVCNKEKHDLSIKFWKSAALQAYVRGFETHH